ncbi:MAG: hypothetical protein P8X95_11600 [Anaerolineales bacterium]|jgi:hypothetical protein
MSEEFHRGQAAQGARVEWIIGGLVIAFIIAFVVILGLFQSDCTKGFDRSAEGVVTSYLDAVSSGDVVSAQACWQRDAYYESNSGCSQACLVKVYGSRFELAELQFAEPASESGTGQQLEAQIEILCTESGATHKGDVVLNTVAQDYPWRHWEIVYSTIGGTVAAPWCR